MFESQSETQKVSPRIVNGIEFYVSHERDECGLSQAGVARLSGIREQTIGQRIIPQILSPAKNTPEAFKALQGKVHSGKLEGDNSGTPAKIILSSVAAAIIEYYAFDSKFKNEIALSNYRKFAKMGIDGWIKEIAGYGTTQDDVTVNLVNQQVLNAIQKLVAEVEEVKVIAQEYKDIRKVTVNVYPGLDSMLDQLPQQMSLPPARELVTIKEWLITKGIQLDRIGMIRLGQISSETYKALTGVVPRQALRYKKGRGYVPVGLGYFPEHFPLLETAFSHYVDSTKTQP